MSIFLNWQQAVEKIKNNDNFDYNAAIDYYQKLKSKMFNQLRMNKELSKYSDEELNEILNIELNKFENTLQHKELKEMSENSLNQIANWIEEQFNGENKNKIVEIQSQINKTEESIEDNKKEREKELKRLRKDLSKILDTDSKIKNIINEALAKYKTPSGDYDVIISFLTTYMLNSVKWRMQLEHKVYMNERALTTLMGYYKEHIEENLLKKIYQNQKVNNMEVQLIAGKNTINDLGFIFDVIEGNYEYTEELQLIDEKFFGGQIKTKNIENIKTNFMNISRQAKLAEQFNSQMKNNGFNKYSWSCGVAFLGQTNHILQSLGKNNVLFISGPNRYFMDEFIQKFRREKIYLAFKMNEENHMATGQVGLQRFVENRKNMQNKLLKRFEK